MNRRSRDLIAVLHAEDDSDFADMAKLFLESVDERLAVETVANADEGLARLDEKEFDCIVSDYTMPGLNGIEFFEATRAERRILPFILFTGEDSEEVVSTAISAGVTDYIQKSHQSSQYTLLANKIVTAVEATHAERAQR